MIPTATVEMHTNVEQWDFHEIELAGPADGNPFLDVSLTARFTCGGATIDIAGFYDGDGTYKVRFMPNLTGVWSWRTISNEPRLHGRIGEFTCVRAGHGNRGPVRVHNTYHFQYADGTAYKPVGTTAYAWTHQDDELATQTLEMLAEAPFNKVRFCVFPKHYAYNGDEPRMSPFVGDLSTGWDFTCFNPDFFRDFEHRVGQLRDLGIQADVILFHPYDGGHWGFDRMDAESDDRYLRYVVARLAAYRNVWWSVANEFDLMTHPMFGVKSETDFDRYCQTVRAGDPYGHLLSVHNWTAFYDHNRPWITHASIQGGRFVEDPVRAALLRHVYRKPLVFDEIKYEGDIPEPWGNLSAEELVHRFWNAAIASAYASHGETVREPRDILWWSKGGVLHGDSPARLRFLRDVLDSAPSEGLEPIPHVEDCPLPIVGREPDYFLIYFGRNTPATWPFFLPQHPQVPREYRPLKDGMRFHVDILDTWTMTVTRVPEAFTVVMADDGAYAAGDAAVPLPDKPYLALRIRRVEGTAARSTGCGEAPGAGDLREKRGKISNCQEGT